MSDDRERLRAAMAGQERWGQHASATEHRRYAVALPEPHRRKCACGKRQTHTGRANGLALMSGCEWCTHRWVRDQTPPGTARRTT